MEATLNLMEEGVAILDEGSQVVFWNRAAASLTGYSAEEMNWRRCPENLYRVDQERSELTSSSRISAKQTEATTSTFRRMIRAALVSIDHKLGHFWPGMLRRVALEDSSGQAKGVALLFYPVEESATLPHGNCGEDRGIERSQADMEDRLDVGPPPVDHQPVSRSAFCGSPSIRRRCCARPTAETPAKPCFGPSNRPCSAGMKPAEVMGRWGYNEFLVLAHERTADLLDRARATARPVWLAPRTFAGGATGSA